MTGNDFDARMREIGQRAIREMSISAHVNAPPWEPVRRRRRWQLPIGSPLALAAGIAVAIALAAPLFLGHALRGGTAGQNQPPEVTKPADVILADMTTAMSHLHAFHMVERGTASDGSPVVIDLRMDRVGNALESWTMGGQTDTVLIWHSDLFVKGPHVVPAEWHPTVGDRWLATKSADLAPTLVATISPARIISCFTGDHGTLAKDGEHTVNGHRSIRLVSTAMSPQTIAYTLDVAIDGTPYALHFETDAGPSSRPDCQGPSNPSSRVPSTPADGSTGHEVVDFSDFDSAELITPPTDYIDAAALSTPAP
jgi:hypothetical protein